MFNLTRTLTGSWQQYQRTVMSSSGISGVLTEQSTRGQHTAVQVNNHLKPLYSYQPIGSVVFFTWRGEF
jgi:hypothetical protein